jgi:hypothetical protein
MKSRSSVLWAVVLILSMMFIDTANAAQFPSNTAVFNGHTYYLFDDSYTWHDAEKYCEEIGGYLATITSQEEQQFIVELLESGSKKHYWLGGRNSGDGMKWITGEAFSYSNWDRQAPDRLYRSSDDQREDYLEISTIPNPVIYGSTEYSWNDIFYDGVFPGEEDYFLTQFFGFICEIDEGSRIGKKAIYYLPGYMGSRLYDNGADEVWVDIPKIVGDIGHKRLFQQNEDGTGMKEYVLPGVDKEGPMGFIFDASKILGSLRERYEQTGEYDVVFYPYNWLGDLNESAQYLKDNIELKKYDKVVFVTHSTGGLLLATYISLFGAEKIEKAVVIAAPLYGMNTVHDAVENGSGLENMVPEWLVEIFNFRTWIKSVTHNSPNTYQLFPSNEFITKYPLTLSNRGNTETIGNIYDYYRELETKTSINKQLLSGATQHSIPGSYMGEAFKRSHRYLRDNVFGKDIVKVLERVGRDNIVLFTGSGFLTRSNTVYRKSAGGREEKLSFYSDDGDGTVLRFSSSAGDSYYGVPKLPHKDFRLKHGDLVHNENVFSYVLGFIDNSWSPRTAYRSSRAADDGMSSYIKLHVLADRVVDFQIIDRDSNTAASYLGGALKGFDWEKFIYSVTTDDGAGFIIYLPNTGYKVSFSYGGAADAPVNFSVEATTLDGEGFNTSMATYDASRTGASGEILTLDAVSKTVTKDNIGSLVDGRTVTPVIFHDNWEIEPEKTLAGVGASGVIQLSGADAAAGRVKASDLAWSSSDPAIVSVSDNGTVTAKASGEAVIFAAAQNASYKFSRSVVTVSNAVNPDEPVNPVNPVNPSNPGDSSSGGGGCSAVGFGAAVMLTGAALIIKRRAE